MSTVDAVSADVAHPSHRCPVRACRYFHNPPTHPPTHQLPNQVRTGGICLDFYGLDRRFQAYDCCSSSACVNQHYDVAAASGTISSAGQGVMAPFKNMSVCVHSIPPSPPPPPPPPPPPKKSALWCPQYHEIQGHYDPSGMHVDCVRVCVCGKAWGFRAMQPPCPRAPPARAVRWKAGGTRPEFPARWPFVVTC